MSWFSTHLTIVFGLILAIITAVYVLQQRRTPQSTAAWLLFVVTVPYIAIPIFLALGFRKQGSRYPSITFHEQEPGQPVQHELDQVFRNFGFPAATAGNTFDILTTGEAAYESVHDIVCNAKRTLDVSFYLLSDDEVGRSFVALLTARAHEGIKVRLLLDRLGTIYRPKTALQKFISGGGELRFFSPFLHAPDNGHMNLRNHRKMIIADDQWVFAGGMNMGGHYLGPFPDPHRFADLAYSLKGQCATTFVDVFRSDWRVAGGAPASVIRAPSKIEGQAILQLVSSGPDTRHDALHDTLVHALHNARKRIWITTPYFLPTEILGNALVTAARRGVDVRILIPRKSNQPVTDIARGDYVRELQASGCRMLFHESKMVHAKAGLIDDYGYIGSTNFDIRSMLLNFETALFIYDTENVRCISDWFLSLTEACSEEVATTGFVRRMIESIFRLGAPVL